jgi:hypothetical protein
VLDAINRSLVEYEQQPLRTIGELFGGRSMLLTYPELDIYPERGPADYYGITDTGEGASVPDWPLGHGPRIFAYLYHYYAGLEGLLLALQGLGCPILVFCRGIDEKLKKRYSGAILFSESPMSVSRLLPECDAVICHGSHQMTAQALLAGKPVLLLPTQLEQFLIMRRVVRYGAGLGVAPDVSNADVTTALHTLLNTKRFAEKARNFATTYASHDRHSALTTMIARIESAL